MAAPAAVDPKARRWRVVVHGATVAALGSFLASVGLWFHFDGTRPHVADPVTGRVHPLNTHGSIVYLNGQEDWLLSALFAAFIVFGVIAFAIDRLKRPFRPTWER